MESTPCVQRQTHSLRFRYLKHSRCSLSIRSERQGVPSYASPLRIPLAIVSGAVFSGYRADAVFRLETATVPKSLHMGLPPVSACRLWLRRVIASTHTVGR